MASDFDEPERPIQGQLLRFSRRRQAVMYLRDDALWVADFVDGRGEISDARTWFRFNCASGSPSHMRRRMIQESAMPLSSDLAERVERLHRLRHPEESQVASGWNDKT